MSERDAFEPEEAEDRLRMTITADAVLLELVSSFAGDRPMTDAEDERIRDLQRRRGYFFFSDLLYAVSHHYFPPEIAEGVWDRVLAHKVVMSERLERNVRIAVATLDYLSNITGEVGSLTLMSEPRVAEIVNLSMRDGMTGLFNHSTCYELLELQMKNHRRYGVGAGLILLDIDDFKLVNDQWGHQEGDRVLRELGGLLEEETRDSDICCRFGGEEFAVILPFTNDRQEAFEVAERVRLATGRITTHERQIALSAGVALCSGVVQTPDGLVARADRALYEAKRKGKNQVVVCEPSGSAPF